VTRGLVPVAATAALTLGFGLFSGVVPAVALAASTATTITIIAPITVPAPAEGLLDAATLEQYTGVGGLLTRELDEVVDRPVTLAIDPMIIASIRLLGTDSPASATDWLRRLEAATNESFALQWADADAVSPLHAGATAVLSPTGLDFAIVPSRFSDTQVENTPSPDPDATTEPGADTGTPSLPSTASLLDFPYTLPGVVWAPTSGVTHDDLTALAADGLTTVLLASSKLSARGRAASGHIGESTVIAIDEKASRTLSEAGATIQAREQLETQLADDRTAHLVVALDRTTDWATVGTGRVLSELLADSHRVPTDIADIVTSTSGTASLAKVDATPDRDRSVTSLLELERLDSAFATIAARPEFITQKRRVELLSALSIRWQTDPSREADARHTYTEESTALRSSVKVVKSSSIFLLADRATVPVVIGNTLDQAVTVFITLRPSTPLLSVDETRVKLVIAPDSQRKALIPVKSISNGVVDLRIDLTRADNGTVGNSTHVRITVQAGWETPVTFAIAALVVAVFILGFYRTLAKRRRERAHNDD
jgi:hypothetical protein